MSVLGIFKVEDRTKWRMNEYVMIRCFNLRLNLDARCYNSVNWARDAVGSTSLDSDVRNARGEACVESRAKRSG